MRVVRDVKGVKIFQSDQYLQPSQISSFSPGCQYWLVPQLKKEVINNDDLEFVLAMIVVNEALESVNVQF